MNVNVGTPGHCDHSVSGSGVTENWSLGVALNIRDAAGHNFIGEETIHPTQLNNAVMYELYGGIRRSMHVYYYDRIGKRADDDVFKAMTDPGE